MVLFINNKLKDAETLRSAETNYAYTFLWVHHYEKYFSYYTRVETLLHVVWNRIFL